MCTLSFVPKADGFLLGMNRDEQRSRAIASPPVVRLCGDLNALYPSEPSGGTWVGINQAGLCVALINWYSRPQYGGTPAFSRGSIIPSLLSFSSLDHMERSLLSLPVAQLNPFRIFMFGSESDGVREYRCDGAGAARIDHPWKTSHWFSSGRDEASAISMRGAVCRKAVEEPDAGTFSWLERLHASHIPREGSDSICMHRDDAMTVSLTILEVTPSEALMRYHDGPPCKSTVRVPLLNRLSILD